MNPVPYFFGTIKDGKISLEKPVDFAKYTAKFEGKNIRIAVELRKKDRTLKENAYYWAVIVRMIAGEMGLLDDQVHEMLKMMFLKVGVEHKGKRYEVARSTTQLSTVQFENYCENIRMWAASELKCTIPLPGEIIIETPYGVPQNRKRVFILGTRNDVMTFNGETERVALHMGAVKGEITYPQWFKERYGDLFQQKLF